MVNNLLAIVISYFIGSIPTGYILGRWVKGIDIRDFGSGNVGATNSFRVLGKGYGIVVLLVDILKGLFVVVAIGNLFQVHVYGCIILGLFAVIGHNWSIFLKFRGGKGIATTLGVLMGFSIQVPSVGLVLLVCVMTWLLVFIISGYVSLASMIASIMLPISLVVTNHAIPWVLLGVVICLMVVIRHRPNIKRLLEGQEPRAISPFTFKRH